MLPKLFFISMLSLLILAHSSSHKCVDHQKRLLLELKNELIFNSSISRKLVQWNRGDDCCKWYGVECDDAGNVISLHLDGEAISSGIWDSSSLFKLIYLKKLNLAYNHFNSTLIPKGIQNLIYLTHLNLSFAGFGGQVPVQLSSLTRLVSLDISYGDLKLEYSNLEMLLSNLTGLRELYLDRVNITSSDNDRREWSHIISSYSPNLTTLSLQFCDLSGPLAKSFWQLHSMSILLLDGNNLSAVAPHLFANFPNLTTLSLRDCGLKGFFPDMIFRLPTLQNLDLSFNLELSGSIPSFIGETGYSIKSIVLSCTNFTGSLPSSIRNLTTLSWIELSYCKFTGSIPSTFANLTQLVYVDLSYNFFTGPLSSSMLGGLSNLVYLYLGYNSFSGTIPHFLFYLHSLEVLSLFGNKFNGQVDEFPMVNVSKIYYLGLSGNRLQGPIPDSFFQLHSLEYMYLDRNMFNGTLQLDRIKNLVNFTTLDLSDNDNLSVDVGNHNSSTYTLPHLRVLRLPSCNLSAFPNFIQHCDYLRELDLSNNRIAGEIPIWIWKSQLRLLNLSLNLLTDFEKPYHIPAFLQYLDLHSNQLRGELQLLPPSNIGNDTSLGLSIVLLGNNSLSESIPISLCSAPDLGVLDLSINRLSGNIPSCLLDSLTVYVLDLGRNKISGLIPDHFPINSHLQYLDLNNNILQGKLPNSLQNCNKLEFMNVGGNMIEDTFPCMLPSNLSVVVLHSNKFNGEVKCQTNWPRLQILDISSNNFSGTLEPFNFSSWKAMVKANNAGFRVNINFGHNYLQTSYYHNDGVRIIMKGLEVQIVKIWQDFTAIDFSCNNFRGNIPNAVGTLISLRLLNLSHNALNGIIPKSIDHLRALESLDLSQNSLTGAITEELVVLTFLSVLNLSYNNLVGKIPNGRQLQTFQADSFKGNPGLCGFNLNISCTNHTDDDTLKLEEEKREIEWGYVIAPLGYVVGLGSISWMLLFCRSFRKKCFDQIDDVVQDIFNARDMRRRRRATARRRLARNREVMRR